MGRGSRAARGLWALALLLGLAGCRPPETVTYANPETGVRLEMPSGWEARFIERSGAIVVSGESGLYDQSAVSMTIRSGPCPVDLTPTAGDAPRSAVEQVEENIRRLAMFYEPGDLVVVQEPARVEGVVREVYAAVLDAPSVFRPGAVEGGGESAPAGEAGRRVIELYVIGDEAVYVEVYPGESEALNAQAVEVVMSIRRACGVE